LIDVRLCHAAESFDHHCSIALWQVVCHVPFVLGRHEELFGDKALVDPLIVQRNLVLHPPASAV